MQWRQAPGCPHETWLPILSFSHHGFVAFTLYKHCTEMLFIMMTCGHALNLAPRALLSRPQSLHYKLITRRRLQVGGPAKGPEGIKGLRLW